MKVSDEVRVCSQLLDDNSIEFRVTNLKSLVHQFCRNDTEYEVLGELLGSSRLSG